MLSKLPFTFPSEVTVTLRAGSHNGASQLWSTYMHKGVQFKLVVPFREMQARMCNANEEWVLHPHTSPNGHIVFCRADRKVRSTTGEISIVADTRKHVEKCREISVERADLAHLVEIRVGEFCDLAVEDGIVKIIVLDPISFPRGHTSTPVRIEEFVLEFPLSVAEWYPGNERREDALYYKSSGGQSYKVTFHERTWDSAQYFEGSEYEEYGDYEVSEEALALREERYGRED